MPDYSLIELHKVFESSKDFNEIFDAFQHALTRRIDDLELYKQLCWNPSLSPDERCLFGEKLAKEFPDFAYEVFFWLANIFEVTHAMVDNFDLAMKYYSKAAGVRPHQPEPYLEAARCYEHDLKIPSLSFLIDFLKTGTHSVSDPKPLYHRLAELYELDGNDEMCGYYRRLAIAGANEEDDSGGAH